MYSICINLNGINYRKFISSFVVLTFLTSLVAAPAGSQVLPIVGTSVSATSFQPPVLLGLKIHPENPLLFDFIVDHGQTKLSTQELKEETTKLVKYFLAALTIPDKEVWVNLSPTEKDRIIPDVLGQTTMGKTMLEQDYVLKQLAASLTNPETDLGKKYWDQVNGSTNHQRLITNPQPLATNNFNKVWIMPAKAEVLESNGIVLVGEKRLKVMLAEEYEQKEMLDAGRLTLEKNSTTSVQPQATNPQPRTPNHQPPTSNLSSEIFRSTILPTIEKAVNEGKDFADVRQIYNSVILAAWYKKALKESLLGKIYTDKGKVAGVETDDKEMKQRIYEQYLAAFKKGAYSLIKEETDENGDLIPRKYFSGGIEERNVGKILVTIVASPLQVKEALSTSSTVSSAAVELAEPADAKAVSSPALQGQDDSTFVASSNVNVEIAQKLFNNLPSDPDDLTKMLRDMASIPFFAVLEALIRAPEHEKYLTFEDLNDFMLARNSQLTYVGKNSLIAAIVRYKTKEKPSGNIPTMEYALDFLKEVKEYLNKVLFLPAGMKPNFVEIKKDLAGNDLGRVKTMQETLRKVLSGTLPQRTPAFYQSIVDDRLSLPTINKRFDGMYSTLDKLYKLKNNMRSGYFDPNAVANEIVKLLLSAPESRGQTMIDRLISTAMLSVYRHSKKDEIVQILRIKANEYNQKDKRPKDKSFEYIKALKGRLESIPILSRVDNTESSVGSAPVTPVGGIDFDPTNMNLQIKRNGRGVPLPLPQQNLEQINIQGLFPVIINITPINAQTLPIFLGQAPQEPQIVTTTSG